MRYAMAIDLDRCIGCRTCAVICKDHNAQPLGIWWNRVFTSGNPEYDSVIDVDGDLRMEFVPISCQHCSNAPCEQVCPTQATYINDAGAVLIDFEKCIGCRMCASACPYGVRQFNWGKKAELESTDGGVYAYGYPDDYRDHGHLVYTQTRPEGVMEKCTFCVQYTSQGIEPACCSGCPANARLFGDMDDPNSLLRRSLEGRETFKLAEEYGTEPNIYYLPSSKAKNMKKEGE